MNEAQWLSSTDPKRMLNYLQRQRLLRSSERKKGLFACACARLVWPQMTAPEARFAVELLEAANDDLRWLDKFNHHCVTNCSGLWISKNPADRAALPMGPIQAMQALAEVPGFQMGSLCPVVRDIFGNPFQRVVVDPDWLLKDDRRVFRIAQGIYRERAFDRLPILADAADEAGCADQGIMQHLRTAEPHFHGCWAVDALLDPTILEPLGAVP